MKPWRTDGAALRLWVAAAIAALVEAIFVGTPHEVDAEPAAPASRSFSRAGLDRVGDYIKNEIASGKIPGAIVLIQQHGKPVYFEKFGVRDVATQLSMTDDTIFRLYSMSKPITSVAAMMLVDDGGLALDDPVSKYIPSFADAKVGVEKPDGTGKHALKLEPLDRPIKVEDLLRSFIFPAPRAASVLALPCAPRCHRTPHGRLANIAGMALPARSSSSTPPTTCS